VNELVCELRPLYVKISIGPVLASPIQDGEGGCFKDRLVEFEILLNVLNEIQENLSRQCYFIMAKMRFVYFGYHVNCRSNKDTGLVLLKSHDLIEAVVS